MKRTIFIFTMLACFSVLYFIVPVNVNASEKDDILRACGQLFGEIVDERQNLFSVNRFYILRAEFDKNDNLALLAVEPKYYFEESHPDWAESEDFEFLSKTQYKILLTQLDGIKPKGVLVKPASPISIVTNVTAWHKETYKKAVLTWGVSVDLGRGENPPYEVKWLKVDFEKGKNEPKIKFFKL